MGRSILPAWAYPKAADFQNPTHVNIITDYTFSRYFDDNYRWATIYGFKGAFRIHTQIWNGDHFETALVKVDFPILY